MTRWVRVAPEPDEDRAAIADRLVAQREPDTLITTSDEPLIQALLARGGRVRRRARDYEYDLRAQPPPDERPPPAGFALTPVTARPAELAAARAAAYAPGHPDHDLAGDHLGDLTKMLAGEILGPLLAEASWQVVDEGGPRGAILVVARPDFAGVSARPWVVDVFVDPALQGRGLGGALVRRSLAGAAAAGHALMGLVVTDGNPARHVYEAAGFRLVDSGASVDLP